MKRVHLAVYVTAEEAEALRRAATKSDRANFSEWAREFLLRRIGWKKTTGPAHGEPPNSK